MSASWSTAARLVQHEYDSQDVQSGCNQDDNPQADLVDHIRNTLANKPIIKHETLIYSKENINQMTSEAKKVIDKTKGPQKIIPPRLKKLNEALDKATKESDEWKELHHQRKNMYNFAKLEKRQVVNGEKIVSNKNR